VVPRWQNPCLQSQPRLSGRSDSGDDDGRDRRSSFTVQLQPLTLLLRPSSPRLLSPSATDAPFAPSLSCSPHSGHSLDKATYTEIVAELSARYQVRQLPGSYEVRAPLWCGPAFEHSQPLPHTVISSAASSLHRTATRSPLLHPHASLRTAPLSSTRSPLRHTLSSLPSLSPNPSTHAIAPTPRDCPSSRSSPEPRFFDRAVIISAPSHPFLDPTPVLFVMFRAGAALCRQGSGDVYPIPPIPWLYLTALRLVPAWSQPGASFFDRAVVVFLLPFIHILCVALSPCF